MIKTLSALRAQFWQDHPEYAHQWKPRKRQNDYPTDTRCAWVDYVDAMARCGEISEALASRATL
jgi:hypothetical protein